MDLGEGIGDGGTDVGGVGIGGGLLCVAVPVLLMADDDDAKDSNEGGRLILTS